MKAYVQLCDLVDEAVPQLEHGAIEAAARGVDRSELAPKRRKINKLTPEHLKLKDTDLELAYLSMTLLATKRSGQAVDPRLESVVNMAQVQQLQSTHRSAGGMDVAFMNGHVEDSVAEEGEVV